VDIQVEQVGDNVFDITVQGAKSIPVSYDKEFNIPLYSFVPVFDERESLIADEFEDLSDYVKELRDRAFSVMEETNKLDVPNLGG